MKNFEKFFDIDSLCIIDLLNSKINKFKKTKFILTGASGFLGSNFCSFFYNLNKTFSKKDKIKIYAFDNFIRGKPFWFERYENSENFEIINSDIVNNKNFPNADFIIHAASIASPIFYRKYPIQTMDTNVIGKKSSRPYFETQL